MRRKLMFAGLLVLGFLLLLILALPFLLDLNRYRDQYLPLLEGTLQRKVELGDVRLRLFPTLGLHAKQIQIADDPAFSTTPFLVVPSADVIVSWKPLLQRKIQVEQVLIHDPRIRIIRAKDGTMNMASMGRVSTETISSSPNSESAPAINPLLGVVAVENLSLSGGLVTFEDRQAGDAALYTLSNLVLTTESVQWGGTAAIRAKGILEPGKAPVDFRGQVGPLNPTFDFPLIDFSGNVGKVTWSANGALAKGILDMEVQVPRLGTEEIPWAGEFPMLVVLSDILAHVTLPILAPAGKAGTPELRIHPVRGNLHLGKGLVHVEGEGTPTVFHVRGTAAALSTQDLPLMLSLAQPVVFENLETQVTIQGKRVDVPMFQAKVFQGSVEGNGGWVDSGTSSVFVSQGALKGFAVEQVQAAVFPSRVIMTGIGEVHWNLKGSLDGHSHPQWSGPVSVSVDQGQLSGVDLLRIFEEALNMPGLFEDTTPGITKFTNVQVKAEGHPQGLRITYTAVESSDFSLQGKGMVGWGQQVDVQGEFFFPPMIAERIIHRFPLAKVAMKGNRLRIPFVVDGTVQEPVFRLNTHSLGEQIQQRVNQAIEKVLQGDDKDMQDLLNEGKDLLRQLFRP